MPLSTIAATLRAQLLGPGWNPLARLAWCRRQRRLLGVAGHAVLWIRGTTGPWAAWGERHGYFQIERMDGLPYLRALDAVASPR